MQLAQVNIARMKGAIDSPVMSDFAANLDRSRKHGASVRPERSSGHSATSVLA